MRAIIHVNVPEDTNLATINEMLAEEVWQLERRLGTQLHSPTLTVVWDGRWWIADEDGIHLAS